MDCQGARIRRPGLARRQGIGIAIADNDQVGTVVPDAPDIGRRRNGRHEDLGRDAKPHRRVGDGRAVIATRCRDHAGGRHLASEQVRKGAARLERAGML
jgi:hypothetical protein